MRRGGTLVGVALGISLLTSCPASAQTTIDNVPGAQQAYVHQPWSPNYLPLLPNQPIRYGSSSSSVSTSYHHHHNHGSGNISFYFGSGYPNWGYGYGWGGPYYDGYPYGYAPGYYFNEGPIILPPLVVPAETMYGPQAVRQFMGVDQPQTNVSVIVANKANVVDPAPAKPVVRVTNVAAKERAGKFIAFGDAQFGKQNYNQALERYKLATQTAPDLADCFFRQGFAQIAMSNYESAARSIRRGLKIQPDWSKSTFRVDQLYGEDRISKAAHVESLARAVDHNPNSADLLMLLGVQLYFDGEQDRALPLFERSSQLGGNDDGTLQGFLPPRKIVPPAPGKDI